MSMSICIIQFNSMQIAACSLCLAKGRKGEGQGDVGVGGGGRERGHEGRRLRGKGCDGEGDGGGGLIQRLKVRSKCIKGKQIGENMCTFSG